MEGKTGGGRRQREVFFKPLLIEIVCFLFSGMEFHRVETMKMKMKMKVKSAELCFSTLALRLHNFVYNVTDSQRSYRFGTDVGIKI